MIIDPWIFAFSALTVIATIWMGFWSAKRSKTTHDFFVAGRSVSVGWNASAISGEYLSAASFMGVAGMVMSSGYDALWYPVCYACGYLFLLLFIAGPLRRFGAYTIPDFAEGRFDSPLFRKIAVVFVLFIGFFYTMPQMKGAGTTLAYIFPGLPYWAGVVLVGAVITLNVALGGMKGITLVQAFQYWLKMFAISVPVFVLMAVYGHYGKQLGVNGNIQHPTLNIEDRILPFHSAAEMNQINLDQRPLLYVQFGKPSISNAVSLAVTHPSLSKGILEDALGLNSITQHGLIITNRPTLAILRHYYAFFSGKAVYWFIDYPREEQQYSIDLKVFRTKQAAALAIETLLQTNAVNIFQLNSTQALFLSERQFEVVMRTVGITNALAFAKEATTDRVLRSSVAVNRKPLPERAPADSTWLNAFGPLTTKAAKAAAAALANHAAFINKLPLRADLAPDTKMTVNMGETNVAKALLAYSELTGRTLLPRSNSLMERIDSFCGGRLSRRHWVKPATRPDTGVVYHRDGRFSAGEVKEHWEAVFQTHGIIVVPEGKKHFRAVEAAKSKTSYAGPLLTNSFGSAIENSLERLLDKVSGGRHFSFDSEQAYSFSPTNQSAFDLVLTSTMDRQYTRRISEIRYSPELTNLFISWPSESRLIKAKDFSKEMHPVLQSNGVTVIDEGEVVTALLTKDAKVKPANPEDRLAKHERPLALLYTYSLIIALVCGTAGLPHILVRFYTNPDGVAAKRTTMWVMILIGVFYVFPPIFGVLGRNLLPELYAAVGAKGTDKIVLELPRLLNEKYAPLGSILSGITCAGAFAAFMSTFSGLLVSMTGALAHDVYGRMLRPQSTPDQRLQAFKICAVIVGAVAILLGMQVEPFQINFMVGQAFAIAAASYFPLLFMSAWWRGMTMKGAATGMLAGGLLALAGISLTSFTDLKWLPLDSFWVVHPLLRILCEQPAIWAVPLAITLMVVVSKLTRSEIPP